jgi:hypothetical protein
MSSAPFFLCSDCGSDHFLLTPDRGPRGDWFVICKTCVTCYELQPNGRICLVRAGIHAPEAAPEIRSFSATET